MGINISVYNYLFYINMQDNLISRIGIFLNLINGELYGHNKV